MMQDCGDAELDVKSLLKDLLVKHQPSLQQTYNLAITENTPEAFEKSAMGWIFCFFWGGGWQKINKQCLA